MSTKTIEFSKRDGSRTSVTLDPATLAVIPADLENLRGWVNNAVVMFSQHLFPGMVSAQFGDIILALADNLETSPSAVVRAACAWWAGKAYKDMNIVNYIDGMRTYNGSWYIAKPETPSHWLPFILTQECHPADMFRLSDGHWELDASAHSIDEKDVDDFVDCCAELDRSNVEPI